MTNFDKAREVFNHLMPIYLSFDHVVAVGILKRESDFAIQITIDEQVFGCYSLLQYEGVEVTYRASKAEDDDDPRIEEMNTWSKRS